MVSDSEVKREREKGNNKMTVEEIRRQKKVVERKKEKEGNVNIVTPLLSVVGFICARNAH